jgi:hypothetical protein
MRMRFWFEITRGNENWVKLALGHFLMRLTDRYHAPFEPKPGRISLSPRLMVLASAD